VSGARGPVLLLGGTAEAFVLAEELVGRGVAVTTSLAGRVKNPRRPAGKLRIGGFGGVAGLARYLQEERVAAVVDATHPFAEQISANALAACRSVGVPLLRLERPSWRPGPGDRWLYFADGREAAAFVKRRGGRVLLTVGRGGLEPFVAVEGAWFLVRCVELPERLPPNAQLLLARGPFTLEDEEELIRRHRIDLVVTKESGGAASQAKLLAARRAGIEVAVIRRGAPPAAEHVETVGEAVGWVARQLGLAAP